MTSMLKSFLNVPAATVSRIPLLIFEKHIFIKCFDLLCNPSKVLKV